MPRLPALYKPKRKWRLASQVDPLDCLEQAVDLGGIWHRNYASLEVFEDQVMHDQAARGQVLVLSGEGDGSCVIRWDTWLVR